MEIRENLERNSKYEKDIVEEPGTGTGKEVGLAASYKTLRGFSACESPCGNTSELCDLSDGSQMDDKWTDQIGARTVTSTIWSGIAHAGRQIPQFAFGVVLARTLSTEDFGLLGMVLVFSGFASLLSGFGIATILIQRPKLDETFFRGAHTLSVACGIMTTLIFVAASPLIAGFYGESRLTHITMVMAMGLTISSLYSPLHARLKRELNFKPIAVADILAIGVSGITAIVLAMRGFGVWSLVWMQLIDHLMQLLVYAAVSGFRLRFRWDRKVVAEILGFGSDVTLAYILAYLAGMLDNLLIGKFLSKHSLGIYSRAYSLMLMPITQISNVIFRVLFPAFSRIQDDRPRLKQMYLRAIGMIGLLAFPMMIGLFVTAEHFVLVVYGAKWQDMIDVIRILCVVGAIKSVSDIGVIYLALGESKKLLHLMIWVSAVTVLGFGVGIAWGSLTKFALVYMVLNLLLHVPRLHLAGKLIGMSYFDIVKTLAGCAGCATAMGGAVWGIDRALPATWHHGLALGIEVAAGVGVYWVLVRAFKLRSYRIAVDLVAAKLRHDQPGIE